MIARWEGAVFLAYYVAYTVHIVLRARGYQLTGPLGFVFAGVAVSLTLVTLAVLATRRR